MLKSSFDCAVVAPVLNLSPVIHLFFSFFKKKDHVSNYKMYTGEHFYSESHMNELSAALSADLVTNMPEALPKLSLVINVLLC